MSSSYFTILNVKHSKSFLALFLIESNLEDDNHSTVYCSYRTLLYCKFLIYKGSLSLSIGHSLKYQRFTPPSCKDRDENTAFAASVQFLLNQKKYLFLKKH